MTSSTSHTLKSSMSKALSPIKIIPRRSSERGHADHGWLNSYHTFSFASYHDARFQSFGSLRVLNEDRVAAGTGFPTHPHRDAEIFSYVLSGELTHRDSMVAKGSEGEQSDEFYRMKRGDVQFTTGGRGVAHSEQNESDHGEEVHFLQIWALPWKRGLVPRYHTRTFGEEGKREGFLPILSPLKAGVTATEEEENVAEPSIRDTIPIHADFVMGAGIIGRQRRFEWMVGKDAVRERRDRKVYVHVPMTKGGEAKLALGGEESVVLGEGDGAFVKGVDAGDVLGFENVGECEVEVVVLDSD